jgi:hypothetical protein
MYREFAARASMLAALFLVGTATASSQAQERGGLETQHVHEEVRSANSVGTLAPDKVLHFDMLLPVGAAQQLDRFLSEVNDPASGSYRHFVTPAEFTARFGPSQAAWDELVGFAKRSGFTIIGGSRDEMDLRLEGSVRAIETAFKIKLRVFNHPTEPRTFYSPDTEPSVDMQAAIWHISGLDNFSTPQPRVRAQPRVTATPKATTGACPGNSYCGSDMRAAYYGSGVLTGAGQSIGLVEFAGYDSADLTTYFNTAGQTNHVPINAVSTDGTSVSCVYAKGCDDTEQTIDMTQALGMAPGLAQLNVYVGSSDTAILSAMSVPAVGSITGKVDAQLSCSWGWGPADPGIDDPLFKKLAAQGQSFFTAAGDSGAYSSVTQDVYPADDANVTVVGGSDLSTTGPSGAWLSETAWSDGGGGYFAADDILMPAWQTAAVAAFNARSPKAASTSLRNSPDVAAEANFDFYVCADQQACTENRYGGTSFAAPMWAGYMALVNQQAALNGQAPVGFLNTFLYALGNASGNGYGSALHDITAGNNGYPAVAGYDLATGWGSPNGAGLISALLGSVGPGFKLTASGPISVPAGGKGSLTLTSTASGGFNAAIALAASGQPNGMTVSFSPASVTGSGSSTVTFQAAASVPAGSYTVILTGTSAATGSAAPKNPVVTTAIITVTTPAFALAVNGSLTVPTAGTGLLTLTSAASGGFSSAIGLSASGQPSGVTVSFSPASITGSGTSTLSFQVAATTAAGVYPITVTGTSGSLKQSATLTLTVTIPTFSLAASTASLSLNEGMSGTLVLSSSAAGGFAAPVTLSAKGQPSGVSVGFSPATINGAGSSTVNVTVGAAAIGGSFTLVLTGTSGSLQQSLTVMLTIKAATFSITPAATSMAALQGASGSMMLSTSVTGVLNGPIALSVSGQPGGVIAGLSSASVVPPGSVTLSVTVAASVAAGSYPLIVTAIGNNVTQKFTVTLVVGGLAKPTFVFGVGTTALTLTHGTSGSFGVQTALTGPTVPAVALSVTGLPPGVTAVFSPSTINGAGMSTVTLTGTATATPGTTMLTFSGASGSNTQSSTVALTVN